MRVLALFFAVLVFLVLVMAGTLAWLAWGLRIRYSLSTSANGTNWGESQTLARGVCPTGGVIRPSDPVAVLRHDT